MSLIQTNVKVNPIEIKAKAEQIENHYKSCITTLNEMEQRINGSSQYWNGEAAKMYREVFLRQKKACVETLESLKKYPKEIETWAGLAERIDKKASGQVESIAGFKMF